jgi:dTDP-4-amino-4,6-dideoxygalactose transaminase
MTDIQGALALAQMGRAEAMRERREAIARRYGEALRGIEGLTTPVVGGGLRHAWHLYQIALHPTRSRLDRGALARALREEGIGASVHFKPLHLFPYYQERLGVRPGQFPNAEGCFEETLSLPIYPDLTDADVDHVAERIRFHLTGKG